MHFSFALACTNNASAAARVVASLVRDYGELAKISESRLRREILERSRIWQEQEWQGRNAPGNTLSDALKRMDIDQRAIIWLEYHAGLSVVQIAWVLGVDPAAIRGAQEALDASDENGRHGLAELMRPALAAAPVDELLSRLPQAREQTASRDRRNTLIALGLLLGFFLLMGIVFVSLMNWDADTLPGSAPISPVPGAAP